MKKHLPKSIALLLAILLCLPVFGAVIPVSAADYVKGTNGPSDSYKSSIYYERLCDVSLTGDGRTDVLAIALSQLGYQESDKSGEFSGLVGGTKNFAEYNYNFGKYNDTDGYGYYWCASFVSFCLLQAGCHNYTKLTDWCRNHKGDPKYIWRELSCNQWATQLRTCGYFANSICFGGTYEPIAGDLIFFTQNGTTESHIGLVLYSDGEKVYTVEGNTSDAEGLESNGGGVYAKSYALDSNYIRGYGILPYAVSNETAKIDYSGARPAQGLYVATKNKYIYETETATSYTHLLPRFSMFTVTEVAKNGRLKGIFEIDGKTVTGYIKNNDDRIIQLSSSGDFEPYQPISELWGYKGSRIDSYMLNDQELKELPSPLVLSKGDWIGLSGRSGFTREIEALAYYFDNDPSALVYLPTVHHPVTDSDPLGGSHVRQYSVSVNIPSMEAGAHTVTFLVRLMDGTIGEIATISYTVLGKHETPLAPIIDTITAHSVKLVHHDGYEYRMDDGEWQSSPVFEGLKAGTTYAFSRRLAASDGYLASDASPILNITTKEAETTAPPPVTTEPPTVETTTEAPTVTTEPHASETTTESGTESDTDPIVPDTDPNDPTVSGSETLSPPLIDSGCNAVIAPIPMLAIALLPSMLLIFLRKKDTEG